jgi:hypothetical protein
MDNPFGDLIDAARAQARREALEEAARVAEIWVEAFGSREVKYVSPTQLATDAMKDVADAIRGLSVRGRRIGVPAEQIECSVGTMTTSAGVEYFVVLRAGDREITPESHFIKGRAEYSVAQYKHFFGQIDEEPDVLEFDTDGD